MLKNLYTGVVTGIGTCKMLFYHEEEISQTLKAASDWTIVGDTSFLHKTQNGVHCGLAKLPHEKTPRPDGAELQALAGERPVLRCEYVLDKTPDFDGTTLLAQAWPWLNKPHKIWEILSKARAQYSTRLVHNPYPHTQAHTCQCVNEG